MIAREHRFHGYGSLKYVHRKSKTVRGPYCALKYVRNDRRKRYRVAVVVSKKVHKSAVVRNRIRRRIYEAVRLAIVPDEPYDLVFIVYSDYLATCLPAEVQKAVLDKLRAARIAATDGKKQ
jgi:ribonuclease P protein component